MEKTFKLIQAPLPHKVPDTVQVYIEHVIRQFHQAVDDVAAEALLKRRAYGWQAQPEGISYQNDPFTRSIRVVENGVVVFQKDIQLEPAPSGFTIKITPVQGE